MNKYPMQQGGMKKYRPVWFFEYDLLDSGDGDTGELRPKAIDWNNAFSISQKNFNDK